MRYLKPDKPIMSVKNKKYKLIYTLDVIDQLQHNAQMPITEIILHLTDKSTRKLAAEVLIKYLTGQTIDINDDKLDYYSVILLNTYISQLKSKEIPGLPKNEVSDEEIPYIDVEYWIYVGTVVLNRSENRVWQMTLGEIRTIFNEHAKYNGWFKEEKEKSLLSL